MYNLIDQIIGHSYETYQIEQIITAICGVLIITFSVIIVDMIYKLIRSVLKKGA